MTISYYIHAWQGLLMFMAGIVSVLGAFAGYVQSGGGEELLRRALANLETGRAQFESISLNWYSGEMIVRKLSHEDFTLDDKSASFKGLVADEVRVKMDLFPWPPNVKSMVVRGMPQTQIQASDDFLHSGKLRDKSRQLPFPVQFVDCNLTLKVGTMQPVTLSGCSGEFRQSSGRDIQGSFSLRQLNGKPFDFKLESVENGGWIVTGDRMRLDTRGTLADTSPLSGKLDPVNLLLKSLFSGDMAADGDLSSMNIVVEPASDKRSFVCDGEVAYANLVVHLPAKGKPAAHVLPFFIAMLLGADESQSTMMPNWLQADEIRTGPRGRVDFHMADGRLDFACDEGNSGAFTFVRQGQPLPPLESLKGSVETDSTGRPRRILLRGFLGEQYSFETRIELTREAGRTYELLLQPRAADWQHLRFQSPHWRFVSRVTDYYSAPIKPGRELPLADFQLELDTSQADSPMLSAFGLSDLSGRVSAQGHLSESLQLKIDKFAVQGGRLVFTRGQLGAAAPPVVNVLRGILGSEQDWQVEDFSASGSAEAQFTGDLQCVSALMRSLKIESGALIYDGLATDLTSAGITASSKHTFDPDTLSEKIGVTITGADSWRAELNGEWNKKPEGSMTLTEVNIPAAFHPQRRTLDARFKSQDQRVNRSTSVRFIGEKFERETHP